ncbi:YheC/YheD family protein [Bacillus sp. JJ1532]|uniref:YheC/YheD family endospore coat-associated protein n=1 Tax=Bacillus sp. JJ1532 TaxID=3122958 RepID=UPI002FFE23DF
MDDPRVGILIDNFMYNKLIAGKELYEKFSFYEEAANSLEMSICFFRLDDVNVESRKTIAQVRNKKGFLVKKEIQIPKVIHNRAVTSTISAKKKIKDLTQMGYWIFNEFSKIRKWQVYLLLMKNDDLFSHLPETVPANRENFDRMIKKYKEIIIKPNSGGLGSGIISISKGEKQTWKVQYDQQIGKGLKEIVFSNELPDIITKKLSRGYIIQQRIRLATYKGNPFDLRVSVQRNECGQWKVTGIVAKVAKSGGYVTNVAKGGECKDFAEILDNFPYLEAKEVFKSIEQLSLKVVKDLSSYYVNLADVGLDIGITNEGFPMFIECNGRDQRYSFKDAGMHDVWKETYATPIRYARFLLDSIETSEKV